MSVYFARVKGYVKIGYSKNPESRIDTITTGTCIKPSDVTYGDSVYLLGWVDGARNTEREIHARFADLHVVGEWFWDSDAFDAFIAADPRGVIYYETSDQARFLLREYPWATRAQVEQAVAEGKASEEPTEDAVAILDAFGSSTDRMAEWMAQTKAMMKRDRDQDRAYWREHRHELAGAA